MRMRFAIKTLFRSTVRTAVTFALLGSVMFALFMQVGEYAVTKREFERAASQYRGIGAVEAELPEFPQQTEGPNYIETDPRLIQGGSSMSTLFVNRCRRYIPLTDAQIVAASNLPYTSLIDKRYITAGVSERHRRLDDGTGFYNYTARCVVEATLLEARIDNIAQGLSSLHLDDMKQIAGYSQHIANNKSIIIEAYSEPTPVGLFASNYQYRITARRTSNYKYNRTYLRSLELGQRYVFVIRFEPLVTRPEGWLLLNDHLVEHWSDAIYPLTDAPENYLELDEYSTLRELVEITDSDLRTFDVVYTEDIAAIMRFAEGDMAVVEGRAIDRQDSADGSQVCVISRSVAEAYELEVGDSITLGLGPELFEQYKGLGAVAATRERYSRPTETATLEIVGIYIDTDSANRQKERPNWCYSINTVFVPRSLLPLDESQLAGHEFSPAEFSFVIDNAWDIPAFLEEANPILDELGLRLIFDDGGWLDIAREYHTAQIISLINIAVFSTAIVAATVFTVYLFIARKKREYAIMRALGATKKKSARAIVIPLMLVSAAAVLAGSGLAWHYATGMVGRSSALAALQTGEGYAVSASLPAAAMLGCALGEIALTLALALAMLRRISARPPLELLHGGGATTHRMIAVPLGARVKSPKLTDQSPGHGDTATTDSHASEDMTTHSSYASAETAVAGSYASSDTAIGGTVGGATNEASVSPAPGIAAQTIDHTDHADRATATDAATAVSNVGSRAARSSAFAYRYVWKHIRRSAIKSALSLLVAALVFCGICQFSLLRGAYEDILSSTVITARFVGLTLNTAVKIADSELAASLYHETVGSVEIESVPLQMVVTNDIARYAGEVADVVFADGYGEESMDRVENFLIVGVDFFEEHGMELGGSVMLSPFGLHMRTVHSYLRSNPGMTEDDIVERFEDKIKADVRRSSVAVTVIGVASTPSGAYGRTLFSPGLSSPAYAGMPTILDLAEFAVADNDRTREFRELGESFADISAGTGVAMVMDTGKIDSIRGTLSLLRALYPVAVAASLMIGGFLCCLIVMQSMKEAAVMRVLGTSRAYVRTMQTLEQSALGMFGLIAGMLGMLAAESFDAEALRGRPMAFAMLYLLMILACGAASSTLATHNPPLELLQVKE